MLRTGGKVLVDQLATSGAMGYGVMAAIAAKIESDRTVVCFAGDGDFLTSCQELATAVHEGADVLFIVVVEAEGPALLHLVVDPKAITPHTTLTAVREGTAARERTETA